VNAAAWQVAALEHYVQLVRALGGRLLARLASSIP